MRDSDADFAPIVPAGMTPSEWLDQLTGPIDTDYDGPLYQMTRCPKGGCNDCRWRGDSFGMHTTEVPA